MPQDFGWLPQGQHRQPRCEHRATFWTVRGQSDRLLTCAAYDTDTGIELRASYGVDDIVATKLFRGADAEEQVAEHADSWRLNLLLKGFREVDERGNDIADEIEDR